MRISFEQDKKVWYGVSYDQVYNGYLHSDLFWCEIQESLGAYSIVWTDNFKVPEFADSLSKAQKHVRDNYTLHTPHSQGSKHPVPIKNEEE